MRVARERDPGLTHRESRRPQGCCGTRPRATSRRRSSAASWSRSSVDRPSSSCRSVSRWSGRAASKAALPARVSVTTTARPSASLRSRVIRPRSEPVQPLGDRPRGHQRRAHQRRRRELVRRAGAAQGRQHVEGRRIEPVPGERGALGQIDLALQLTDPADDPHRRAVEIGSFPPPLLQDLVDEVHVAHRRSPAALGSGATGDRTSARCSAKVRGARPSSAVSTRGLPLNPCAR